LPGKSSSKSCGFHLKFTGVFEKNVDCRLFTTPDKGTSMVVEIFRGFAFEMIA
jgi:hypothetical protein